MSSKEIRKICSEPSLYCSNGSSSDVSGVSAFQFVSVYRAQQSKKSIVLPSAPFSDLLRLIVTDEECDEDCIKKM